LPNDGKRRILTISGHGPDNPEAPYVSIIERRVLTETPADTVRGIALAALAYIIWTLGDTAAKWVLPSAGVALAMFWRGIFGAATVVIVAAASKPGSITRMLRPVRWRLVAVRSGISSFVSIVWYIAWEQMNLIDTYAVGFTAPLIMVVLAVPMLGERIRWRRALATVVGFLGVLVMLRPGGDLWKPVVVLLLIGIVAMSVTRIMTRQLSTTETPECQAFWLLVSHVGAGALTLGWFPQPGEMDAVVWAALVFLGISSGLAHCVYTRAYGLAPVSALAPYEYTMLIWGGIAGYLVFSEVPSWTTLIGAVIIAAAGLYNLHRERARA
jgi:drug/metabolite transporter (DMT)-like permease